MATKRKAKRKPAKKAPRRPLTRAKSIRLKVKASKPAARKAARKKTSRKVESRRTSAGAAVSSRSTSPQRNRSKQFASAVHAYEAGIKLMHAEEFEKAIRCFENLISDYPDEPEIQERAKVLLHACEKKIQEKAKTVLRSADDHYNVGVAELNRRELESAIQHLQHALKLTPKADHVLYALAAANALQGNRDQALQHMKLAIQHRPENRFLAARDSDFESLNEDPDFKQLVTPPAT
ncbi:MAG: tetratricopeptide repeat protein [Acidobacteria bacterium]|nr:tetratricopeptide repeat protein [Acidobacteriota bacterium]